MIHLASPVYECIDIGFPRNKEDKEKMEKRYLELLDIFKNGKYQIYAYSNGKLEVKFL